MSDVKNPSGGISRFKDPLLLAGWIAGLILIAGLFWFFTQPVRNRLMRNAVNKALQQTGDSRSLVEPVSPAVYHGKSGLPLMGSWFTIIDIEAFGTADSEGKKAFVFAFIAEGDSFPCAAVVAPDGKVAEFIPLSSHGERTLRRISPGILDIYIRRIEGGS
jgi:hypothetical protein